MGCESSRLGGGDTKQQSAQTAEAGTAKAVASSSDVTALFLR